MDYETLDWGLEALRIGAAFNVMGSCCFKAERGGVRWFIPQNGLTAFTFDLKENLNTSVLLKVAYSAEERVFELRNECDEVTASIHLNWDGTLRQRPAFDSSPWLSLVRSLVCLDLLTPEIETELGMDITTDCKAQWLSLFDTNLRARTCFETLDWEAEAQRIAAAFGQEKVRAFTNTLQGRGIYLKLPDHPVWIEIEYDHFARCFTVDGNTLDEHGFVYIEWDGTVRPDTSIRYWTSTLGKGLYLLGLITDENEAQFDVSLSAHQKMEWKLEFEKRMRAL